MTTHDLLVLDFAHGSPTYTVHEVCDICDVTLERIVAFVDSGVLQPEGAALEDWRFPAHAIVQARRAWRLQRDLELDLPGLALALDLLGEVDALRREIARLRAQLARFTSD